MSERGRLNLAGGNLNAAEGKQEPTWSVATGKMNSSNRKVGAWSEKVSKEKRREGNSAFF